MDLLGAKEYRFYWLCNQCGSENTSNLAFLDGKDWCQECGSVFDQEDYLNPIAKEMLGVDMFEAGLKEHRNLADIGEGVRALVQQFPITVKGYGVIQNVSQLKVFFKAMESILDSYKQMTIYIAMLEGAIDAYGGDRSQWCADKEPIPPNNDEIPV